MFKVKFTWEYRGLQSFMRKLESILRGRTKTVYAKLGRRVATDMREMVEGGGPVAKGIGSGLNFASRGYTGSTPGGEATESPKVWARTHPRWQKLRGKDDRPLYHTGKFAKSFGYEVVGGEPAVDIGSSDIRSRRFHFGDEALGGRWSWVAPVDGGRIVDGFEDQPLGGKLVTAGKGAYRRFSPVIRPRQWMVVWGSTVDDWWRQDVGGQLGLHA